MPFNRYDTISTSTYDPRSLQETLMVPMMKRQQHDKANEQLYANLAELDKIKPLDKHYNEAQKIKAELSSRINNQASKLATEGFNTNTTTDLFKTNRDIQSMYSPTGKIGQINAAKEAYDKDSAEYLKNATALGHSPEVVQRNLKAIQDKYNSSPIYDDKGKVINMSIDALPPKYVDHIARAREFFKDANMSASAIDNLASSIQSDGRGSYVLSQGAKKKYASNLPQLQSAVNFLNNEINNPNSDVGKSLKYGFKTPQEALEDIKRMSPIYRKTESEIGSTNQISSFTPAKTTESKDKTVPTGIMDPDSTRTIGDELKKVDFSQIGRTYGHTSTGSSPSVAGSGVGQIVNAKGNGKYSYKDVITDPLTQSLYEGSYRKLVKAGRIKQGSDINSPENAQKIGFYMNNHLKIPTIANDVIRADISPNAEMFMGNFTKKSGTERNLTLNQDIKAGFRDVVNQETGETYSKKDFEKGGKAEGYTLEYVGYDSPVNARGSRFKNAKEQSVMPHRAILKDKDGNIVTGNAAVSRTKQEIDSPEFKKAYEINKTYIGAVSNLGEWVVPKGVYSGSRKLKEYRVMYNEDGTISMKKGKNGVPEKMSLSEYQNNMDQIISDNN